MVLLQLVAPCASVLLGLPVPTESFHQRIPHSQWAELIRQEAQQPLALFLVMSWWPCMLAAQPRFWPIACLRGAGCPCAHDGQDTQVQRG